MAYTPYTNPINQSKYYVDETGTHNDYQKWMQDVVSGKTDPNSSWSGYAGGSSSNSSSSSSPSTANPYTGGGSDYYSEMMRVLAEQKAAQQRLLDQQRAQGTSTINQATQDALTQAYIQRELQKKNLPQQAALMGTGGLTESSLVQNEAAYGNNRAAIEGAKAQSLADLEAQLAAGGLSAETDYNNNILSVLQNQQAQQHEIDMFNRQLEAEQKLAQQQAALKAAYGGGNKGVDFGDGGDSEGNGSEPQYDPTMVANRQRGGGIYVGGFGWLTPQEVYNRLASGEITAQNTSDGKVEYRKVW